VAKAWTRHELRSAQARALESHREYILPTRLDDTPVPGLPATIGYIDLRSHSVEEFVQILTRKLGPVRGHVDVGELLWSTSVEDRLRGLMSVAFLAPEPQHLERLLELLRDDPHARNREHAALALDALGDIRAKDGLLAALEDPIWGVRSQAGWGLVHLGKAVLEDVLRVARTAKNPDAVEMARLVLDRI
jgi:HEAT repeat protein